MKKLKKEVGNWVVGEERFWDRQAEVSLFIEHLEEGRHLLLVAPRRVGKTSLMREVARRIESRFICLFIDLQKAQSPADAMAELALATRPHQSLFARTREIFKSTLSNIDTLGNDELLIKLRDGFGMSWQDRAKRLLDDLALEEKPVVIFIDELPILVNRLLRNAAGEKTAETIRQADTFMSFLRSQTIEHQSKLRFVVCGSIGLLPILHEAGLSATVNTFTPFELNAWDSYAAIGCIEALANGSNLKLADGVPQKMVALLGSCVPHHVQMFFMHVYTDAKRNQMDLVTVDDVQRVFDRSMLSNRGHAELSHFEERLALVLPREDHLLALDLLTEAAVCGKLTESAIVALIEDHTDPPSRPMGFLPSATQSPLSHASLDRARQLLDIFEHDGYLRREGDAFVFESRLVREWWKARFKTGFVPANDRRSAA